MSETKWIPLGRYTFDASDYVVFVRGNKKTGLLSFKVKRIKRFLGFENPILPYDIIDVRLQWDKIIEMTGHSKTHN